MQNKGIKINWSFIVSVIALLVSLYSYFLNRTNEPLNIDTDYFSVKPGVDGIIGISTNIKQGKLGSIYIASADGDGVNALNISSSINHNIFDRKSLSQSHEKDYTVKINYESKKILLHNNDGNNYIYGFVIYKDAYSNSFQTDCLYIPLRPGHKSIVDFRKNMGFMKYKKEDLDGAIITNDYLVSKLNVDKSVRRVDEEIKKQKMTPDYSINYHKIENE